MRREVLRLGAEVQAREAVIMRLREELIRFEVPAA